MILQVDFTFHFLYQNDMSVAVNPELLWLYYNNRGGGVLVLKGSRGQILLQILGSSVWTTQFLSSTYRTRQDRLWISRVRIEFENLNLTHPHPNSDYDLNGPFPAPTKTLFSWNRCVWFWTNLFSYKDYNPLFLLALWLFS